MTIAHQVDWRQKYQVSGTVLEELIDLVAQEALEEIFSDEIEKLNTVVKAPRSKIIDCGWGGKSLEDTLQVHKMSLEKEKEHFKRSSRYTNLAERDRCSNRIKNDQFRNQATEEKKEIENSAIPLNSNDNLQYQDSNQIGQVDFGLVVHKSKLQQDQDKQSIDERWGPRLKKTTYPKIRREDGMLLYQQEDENQNKDNLTINKVLSYAQRKQMEAWGGGGLGSVLVKHKSKLQKEKDEALLKQNNAEINS